MDSVLESAAALLREGRSFALAVVIAKDGSAPQGRGAKMLVLPESTIGTIGGGGVEARVICAAREHVLETGLPLLREYDMSAQDAAVSDFICGGRLEVLIAPVDAGKPENLAVFQAAAAAERSGKRSWLLYIVDTDPEASIPFQICANVGGELTGAFTDRPRFARDMLENPVRVAIHGENGDSVRYIADEVTPGARMYLFGGGHVSCQVARLAVGLGFLVTVIDDRADYLTPERFPGCELLEIGGFDAVPALPVDDNTYILIITRGHVGDAAALRWALGTRPYYLGMIGSVSKRDVLYQQLESEGFSVQRLQQVHCPIGLSIGAQTPEEIAVSIMAQIISEKKRKGRAAPADKPRERLFHWGGDSIRWYQNAADFGNFYEKLAERVSSVLPPSSRVCDVGCGIGTLALRLAPGCGELTAIDIMPRALETLEHDAAAAGLTNVRTVLGDFKAMSPPERCYDAMVFCQFGGPAKYYEQARSWCRGKLFFIGNAAPGRNFSATGELNKEVYYPEDMAYLDSARANYTCEFLRLPFGQPFADRDDAEQFMSHYDKNSTPQEIKAYLDERLRETGDARFPLYLPCEKQMVIFEIDV
jgi:xanthine dehydrogenase accessory factor